MDSFTRLFKPERHTREARAIRLVVLANLPRTRLAGLLDARPIVSNVHCASASTL
jgi:hypothetical protein